jgi:hypothetical protein
MNERDKLLSDIQELEYHGYDLHRDNSIRPNTGSETAKHLHAKTAIAQLLWDVGYRVDTEVPREIDGTTRYLDVLGYGCVGRNPIGIELETELDDETRDRYTTYYYTEPMKELYSIEIKDLDADIHTLSDAIQGELGL